MNQAKILRKIKLAEELLRTGETGVKDAIILLKEIEALGAMGLEQQNALSKLKLADLKIYQAFEDISYLLEIYAPKK